MKQIVWIIYNPKIDSSAINTVPFEVSVEHVADYTEVNILLDTSRVSRTQAAAAINL